MALGFKKKSSIADIGVPLGAGLAMLGGPIAPLIMASLYGAYKSDQDEQQQGAQREQDLQDFINKKGAAGYDPETQVNWNQDRPGFEAEQRARLGNFAPQMAVEQTMAEMFPAPEEFGEAKEMLGPDGKPVFGAFGKRGSVRTFPGAAPIPREENVEMVNAFDMKLGRPMGAVNKRALDRLAASEPGRYMIGDKMPGSDQESARPPTPEEMQRWNLDPTGSYGISSKDGKPFVITQPKQSNPTEAQTNAAYNASRISDSLNAVGNIVQKDPGAATSAFLEGTEGIPYVSALGRFAASDNQQIFRNNMADAVDAIITLGTGAAYTGEQKVAARNAYLPQTGDSTAVKEDKYRKLVSVYSAAREKARQAGKDLPEPVVFETLFAPKKAAPTGPTTQGRIVIQNGWRYDSATGQPIGPVTK